MLPQNMPYYRGPRIAPRDETPLTDVDAAYCQNLLSAILDADLGDWCHLSNHPVKFGDLDSVTPVSAHASNNNNVPCLASHILHFSWAVYSFGGGHFVSTIISQNIPFQVSLACDQYESGRTLFHEFTTCTMILASGNELLNYI